MKRDTSAFHRENFLLYLVIFFIAIFCKIFFKYKRVYFSFSSFKQKNERNWVLLNKMRKYFKQIFFCKEGTFV